MGAASATRVPTYCYQCVAGPDLLTVKVEDGVATEVEPNFCASAIHPGGGKVCVKAYGLVQKTYHPNRVLTPMRRTNPRKGRDEDLPQKLVSLLEGASAVLGEAQQKIAGVDTGRLSRDASRTLRSLGDAVKQMNALLFRMDGDKGLLASATRASDALGDTVRGADGVGGQMENTLSAVEKAAKSIQKLANALEKDPDMLLKGRGRGVEANR